MRIRFVLAAAILTTLLACSDSNSPPDDGSKPPAELTVVKLAGDSPALFNNRASFYAVKGEDREVRISFQDAGGEEGEEYLRLRVRPGALESRPDGTPIAEGDSVLITVTVVDPAEMLFDMQPSGLTFSAGEPAELKIHFNHGDRDLDEDGDVDGEDDSLRTTLAIWRQENLGDPFVKVGTVLLEAEREANADILGFSRYALAY